jgi:hypothetical protein
LNKLIGLVVAIPITAAALFLPSAASGANDRLACEFTSLDVIKQTFPYPANRVKRRQFAFSPTAKPPGNHAVMGGDVSICRADVWSGGTYPKADFESLYETFQVPKGIGIVDVTTHVRDESVGNNFDAGAAYEALNLNDTHPIAVPDFGLTRAEGGWFFNKHQFVWGAWQGGAQGVIKIEVSAHRDAGNSLRRAARLIVPNFSLRLMGASDAWPMAHVEK